MSYIVNAFLFAGLNLYWYVTHPNMPGAAVNLWISGCCTGMGIVALCLKWEEL